jgi:hypothetical protein
MDTVKVALYIAAALGLLAIGYWLAGLECEFTITNGARNLQHDNAYDLGEWVVFGSESSLS